MSKDAKLFVLDEGVATTIWDSVKLKWLHWSAIRGDLQPKQFYVGIPALRGIVIAPGGDSLLITKRSGEITEYDLATAKVTKTYQIKADKEIHVLAVSPKGDKIMTTGFHGETVVYSFPECKELKRMQGYGRVQFSPDGKTALTFTKNGRMMLWDLEDAK